MNPLVSVIIAAYNGERFLESTLESVLGQTYQPFEVIVCNDGSTDRTGDILRAYEPRIRVLTQQNGGVSSARNWAAAEASGRYLAFVDQDDIWEPELLARQVRHLEEHPDHGLVYGDSWIIDIDGAICGRRRDYLRYRDGWVFEDLLRGNFIPIETMVLQAEIFRACGGFDPTLRYLEDFDLCLKVAHRYPVGFVPDALARYRIHDRNLSHNMEAVCVEWGRILARVPDVFPGLDDATYRLIDRERRRRLAEAAWHALRRCDFRTAEELMREASPVGRAGLALKIRVGGLFLRTLPAPIARRLGRLLERRRRYGLRRRL
jgi:glycosyltransferase involved in cell wall biosynthesis